MNIFDEYANEYDEWFYENKDLFASEVSAVKSLLDADKTYTEVGVGTGIFAQQLGIKQGIEPSAPMAEYAKKRGIAVRSGCVQQLPLADGESDGIVMITVDCFLKDIQPAFAELARVLRKHGSLVMAFLDRATPLGEQYEANKNDSPYYKDATFRTSEQMHALLKQAGFCVKAQKQTVFTLENIQQQVKDGSGEGVFAVIKAEKEN